MKRYAIVRVEGCNEERLKLCPNMPTCAFCLYGDTKEQLEKKIITAIERAGIDYVQLSKEEIAKEIVEFLGVE